MRRLEPQDTGHDPFLRLDLHDPSDEGAVVDASDLADSDGAVVVYLGYYEAQLVHVRYE